VRKKFLVIIDDSKELKNAIYFAAKRTLNTKGTLTMLYVVNPATNAEWARVSNLIEQEATSDAKKIIRKWSLEIEQKFKIKPEIIIRLGNVVDEIIKLIKNDKEIRFLVLASSLDNDNPGPIIKSISKRTNHLSVPLVIVPASLTEEDIESII